MGAVNRACETLSPVPSNTPVVGASAPVTNSDLALPSFGPRAGRVLLLAAGYFATALIGLSISRQAGNVATLWPPNGMLVAALLLSRRSRFADVLLAGVLGSLAANVFNGNGLVAAGSITAANLVEAIVASTIIRNRTGSRRLFQQSDDVVVLIIASIIAALTAGTLSATSAALLSGAPFASIFIKWVIGDVLGLLVVMPIAVIVHDLIKHGPDLMLANRSRQEGVLVLLCVSAVATAVYSHAAPPVQYLVMPAVLFASFRLGPFGAALSTMIVASLGSLGTAAAAASIASSPDEVTLRVFHFQLNLAVLFLTALPIGAAMAQRARLERDLTEQKERADTFAIEMASLASLDDLTGLANRRHFLDQLDLIAASARRADHPLTLAMLDIDHFKPINDRFGHAVGDAVLTAIGATCRAAVRADDVIGRVGGEEFAMLMPVTDGDTAFRIVDRLREAVAAITIPAGDGTAVSVTISVGLAVFRGQQIDGLLLDADRALYLAKEQGRNRVVRALAG
jgi:diguanylate cyclase (GGDEF)-like protein